MKKAVFVSVVVCLALAGCANTQALKDPQGKEIVAPAAPFKLSQVQVVWQENPKFTYTVSFAAQRGYTGPAPQRIQEKAQADMKAILDFFRADVVNLTNKSLTAANVSAGSIQRITITPLNGKQDDSGWGTGVVLRAVIENAATNQRWQHDIESASGWQLLGPRADPNPTDKYVKNYVDALMSTLRQSGFY
jgi:hypothetical protein